MPKYGHDEASPRQSEQLDLHCSSADVSHVPGEAVGAAT